MTNITIDNKQENICFRLAYLQLTLANVKVMHVSTENVFLFLQLKY